MRAPGFSATTSLAAVVALHAGLSASPPRPLPHVYALQATTAYRAEVGSATFCALYLVAICIRLAWHWRTFTRVGSVLEIRISIR